VRCSPTEKRASASPSRRPAGGTPPAPALDAADRRREDTLGGTRSEVLATRFCRPPATSSPSMSSTGARARCKTASGGTAGLGCSVTTTSPAARARGRSSRPAAPRVPGRGTSRRRPRWRPPGGSRPPATMKRAPAQTGPGAPWWEQPPKEALTKIVRKVARRPWGCEDGDRPTVSVTDRGTLVIQGSVPDPSATRQLTRPPGESAVGVPAAPVLEAARQVKASR
jgi:hypothetical protein